MRFHEVCLFVCTTPALGMVALKLEKDFDDRFLLYYFLSLSLSPSLSLPLPLLSCYLSLSLLLPTFSLPLFSLSLSLPPSFFLPSLLSFLSPSSVSNSTLSRSLSCECTFVLPICYKLLVTDEVNLSLLCLFLYFLEIYILCVFSLFFHMLYNFSLL